ncbi:TPA: hypothetical protein HA317_01330 [Candidatus Woesearchaeota archaeon]|nr:hypothetical protein [Candidatus Woesearchaeota archaeon]
MDAIVHFLVPVVLCRLARVDKRLTLLLSPIALIPDLDYFVFAHRVTFHNIFFGALLVGIAVLLLRKWFDPGLVFGIAAFMFCTHLLLDGVVAYLYPLISYGFGYNYYTWRWVSNAPPELMASIPFPWPFRLKEIIITSSLFIFFSVEAFSRDLLTRLSPKARPVPHYMPWLGAENDKHRR